MSWYYASPYLRSTNISEQVHKAWWKLSQLVQPSPHPKLSTLAPAVPCTTITSLTHANPHRALADHHLSVPILRAREVVGAIGRVAGVVRPRSFPSFASSAERSVERPI